MNMIYENKIYLNDDFAESKAIGLNFYGEYPRNLMSDEERPL